MMSFILSRTHSTAHENVNCRGISSPSEGIGDGLQFNDFTLPVIFAFFFFFDEKVDIPQNFSQDVTNSFPLIKIFLFCFYRTGIWINCNRTLVGFDFNFNFLVYLCIRPSGLFIYMVPMWTNCRLKVISRQYFFLSLRWEDEHLFFFCFLQ